MKELLKDTHPGFTVVCDKCKSGDVYVENTIGWSPESGGWGSLDFVCDNCGHRTEIVEG